MAGQSNDPGSPDDPDLLAEERYAREERQRREAEADMEIKMFEGVRQPGGNPVLPVRLKATDMFCFSCHKGVACWNVC